MIVTTLNGVLSHALIKRAVDDALAEDLGLVGDITTLATVPAEARSTAAIVARRPGVVAGLGVAEAAFRALDPGVSFTVDVSDGDVVPAGRVLVRIAGGSRGILSAERVALNFMGRMSGIASLTRRHVDAVAHTRAAIVDTRKTTPGLRAFEKYAVRCGGGRNHRVGLFDAILIKDNHIVAAGGLTKAIRAAQANAGHLVKIEVEVDTLAQLEEVLRLGGPGGPGGPGGRAAVDVVLLDNMSIADLRQAVVLVGGRMLTEASGGVSLETVRAIAETGVDLISIGGLTHSAPVLDLGLDFEP